MQYSVPNSKKNLIFDNVAFSWPDQETIIKNCSFSILEPGLFMIVGKNGCGKSTLFKLIQRLINPTEGSIDAPRDISMVFQNPDHQILMPTCASELILNVKDNPDRQLMENRVNNVLKVVGLDGFKLRPVQTLSGGQKQRLAIASALISNSSFILMDEPTALLDAGSQLEILKLVKSLTNNKDKPITVLWITHRMEELSYAHKIGTMENGKLFGWFTPSNFKYR